MADIFVSYKKEDREIVEHLVAALRSHGFTVWWDEGLTPRAAWDAALEQEISAAATVVVVWTPRSIGSDWVRTEAHYAQDRGKLIPVMMEDCTLPLAFLLRQTVNLCDWRGDHDGREWRKLLTWIDDVVGTKPGNANIPDRLGPAQPNRFREVVGHLPSGDPIVEGAFVNVATPAGTAFRDQAGFPVMRILPKGAFLMGSPPGDPDRASVEGPRKRIEIPAPFALGLFQVLVSEYEEVTGTLPSVGPADASPRGLFGFLRPRAAPIAAPRLALPSTPVTHISFEDAQSFAARISAAVGTAYRIPSEAEWEYACRAGSDRRYHFGDTLETRLAAFALSAGPVVAGSFPPNALGLYDMHGNVREWVADLWHESYDAIPLDGSPAVEGHGAMRVVRGGGWRDAAPLLRSAARLRATQSARADVIGFRVARALH
jgi:formylglycine-generating enzyme required for sulfatase activity